MTILIEFRDVLFLVIIKKYTIIGLKILHTKFKEKILYWHIEVCLEN